MWPTRGRERGEGRYGGDRDKRNRFSLFYGCNCYIVNLCWLRKKKTKNQKELIEKRMDVCKVFTIFEVCSEMRKSKASDL